MLDLVGSLASASPDTVVSTWWEYEAAVHVLRDPLIRERTRPYVHEHAGIEFDELLRVSARWSYTERLLVLAALDLWGGRAGEVDRRFGLRRLVDALDSFHLERVLQGVLILARRGAVYHPDPRVL